MNFYRPFTCFRKKRGKRREGKVKKRVNVSRPGSKAFPCFISFARERRERATKQITMRRDRLTRLRALIARLCCEFRAAGSPTRRKQRKLPVLAEFFRVPKYLPFRETTCKNGKTNIIDNSEWVGVGDETYRRYLLPAPREFVKINNT